MPKFSKIEITKGKTSHWPLQHFYTYFWSPPTLTMPPAAKKKKLKHKGGNSTLSLTQTPPVVVPDVASMARTTNASAIAQLPTREVSTAAAVLSQFSMRKGVPVAATATPLQMVVVTGARTPSVSNSDYTTVELYEVLRQKGRMGDDDILHQDLVMYVRNDLFPKLKFFMHKSQLLYSAVDDTICYQICADLGLSETRACSWWEKNKQKIAKTLKKAVKKNWKIFCQM